MTLEIKSKIKKIEKWDNKVFLSIYQNENFKRSKIIVCSKIFSFFGNMYFWGIFWLYLTIYGYITKDYGLFILITAGFIQSAIIHVIIRYKLVNRNRPYITLEKEGVSQHDELIREHKSFPSGHVTFFLFFGIIIAYYYQSWSILSIFIILDAIMAITRLILGVHYPTDVIAGFIFGFLYALVFLEWTSIYWITLFYWLGHTFSPIFHQAFYSLLEKLMFFL
jgi:undecaprenyl-diphosphatase